MVPRSVSARANIISGGSIVPRSMQARFDDSSGDAVVSESLTPGDKRSGGDTLATPCRSHGSGAPIDATRGAAVSEAPVGQTPDRSGIGGHGHASAEAGSLEIDEQDRSRSTAFPIRPTSDSSAVFPFVNVKILEHLLKGYDLAKTKYLVDGFTTGFSLGCVAPQPGDCGRNLSSCAVAPEVVDDYIKAKLACRRLIGPFTASPFPMNKISPIGLIPKATPGEFRIIHHLSYPSGRSINDSIPQEAVRVSYGGIDDAICEILSRDTPSFLAKTDIKCAYRIVPIRASERCLLGVRWQGNLYFDCALPMGCSSSSKIFQEISDALVWIAKNQFGCASIVNVLDDFLFIEGSLELCQIALGSFIRLCDLLCIPLKISKTVQPCTTIEFLGLELDSVHRMVTLPKSKVDLLTSELQNALQESSLPLRSVQSIIGKLNFACLAVPIGRPFLRRLIDTTRGIVRPWHRLRLTDPVRNDIEAWLNFLYAFNGKAMMTGRYPSLSKLVCLHTDASGAVGFGAILGSSWLHGEWPLALKHHSIAVKEIIPIVIALHSWSTRLNGECVRVVSDNLSVVCAINAQLCKNQGLMRWVRRLFIICMLSSIHVAAVHIPSKENACADSLSRGLLQRFRRLKPTADPLPTGWSWDSFEDLLQ